MIINVDIREMIKKLTSIFEGKASLLDDIKALGNIRLIASAFLGGASFTILLSISLLILLHHFNLERELIITLTIFLLIYAYQDLAEANLSVKERREKEDIVLFIEDAMETYIIDNSLRKLPTKTLKIILIKVFSRIIGPLTSLTPPKFHGDALLVYKNEDVISFIEESAKKENSLRLKHEQGQPIEQFFAEDFGKPQNITVLIEKSPKHLFPYFFNQNHQKKEKEPGKWTILSIIEDNEVKGYMFIHMYKGAYVKSKITGRERISVKREFQKKDVLLFILVGERKCVMYLKNQINIRSAKYPQNLMNIEIE